MRLIHFSAEPVTTVLSSVQHSEATPKPRGLWVSDEEDYGWREWCQGEEFRLEALAVAHEVVLAPDANILRINHVDGIDDLTRQYHAPRHGRFDDGGYRLNWARLAKRWQGILITPYLYERRLSLHCGWYYTWDCASGCIWDAAAIESISVVTLEPLGGAS